MLVLPSTDMSQLQPGTLIDCVQFTGLVVGDGKIVVLSSDSRHFGFEEGTFVEFVERGSNDWFVRATDGDEQWWVKRDWNGRVETEICDYFDDWYFDDDWDCDLDERLDRYQDYDY